VAVLGFVLLLSLIADACVWGRNRVFDDWSSMRTIPRVEARWTSEETAPKATSETHYVRYLSSSEGVLYFADYGARQVYAIPVERLQWMRFE
jgi:hypothetical protein